MIHEARTIKRAIKPMLSMNLIAGMGMLEYRKKRVNNLLEIAYSGCYVLLYAYTNQLSVEYLNCFHLIDGLGLVRSTFKMIFCINTVLISVLIVVGRINSKEIRKIIAYVDNIDRTLENMGLPRNYRVIYKYQQRFFAICIFLILIHSTITYVWNFSPTTPTNTRIFVTTVLNVPLMYIGICIAPFLAWIRHVRMKFQQLNDLLRGMLIERPQSQRQKRVLTMIYDFESKGFASFEDELVHECNGDPITMRAVKQAHLELTKVARIINDTYGIQLLLTMTTSLVHITCLLYVTYKIAGLDLTMMELIRQLTPTTLLIFTFGSKILTVIHMCDRTSTEAADTGETICELYGFSVNRELKTEIRDFTLQLIQNPLVFTGYGFFDMDRTFMQKVIGSISTYLVILIQIGDITDSASQNINDTLTTTEMEMI